MVPKNCKWYQTACQDPSFDVQHDITNVMSNFEIHVARSSSSSFSTRETWCLCFWVQKLYVKRFLWKRILFIFVASGDLIIDLTQKTKIYKSCRFMNKLPNTTYSLSLWCWICNILGVIKTLPSRNSLLEPARNTFFANNSHNTQIIASEFAIPSCLSIWLVL